MKILGIDPGYNTGWATYHDGKLVALLTIQPYQIANFLNASVPDRVVFEDSRLTSFMFTTVASRPVALNMARKVGQIDAWCRLITDICAELNIPAHGISPKAKGKKLDAKEFTRITGWAGPSNEHTRDAAMVAWPYRGAR
jgi:hypothetical protein